MCGKASDLWEHSVSVEEVNHQDDGGHTGHSYMHRKKQNKSFQHKINHENTFIVCFASAQVCRQKTCEEFDQTCLRDGLAANIC